MDIEVIIYDCDGVIVDSRKSNEAFFNHVLGTFDLPPLEPEQLELIYSFSGRAAIDFLISSDSLREEIKTYMKGVDNSPFISLMSVEPHIKEVVSELRKQHKIAVATNRGKSVRTILQKYDLDELFDMTVTSLDVTEPKPNPECLLKILDHFGIPPQKALFIGDGQVDSMASQGAGIPFLAYKNPSLKAFQHLNSHLELSAMLDE